MAGIFATGEGILLAAGILSAGALVLDFVRFRMASLNRLFLRLMAPLLKEGEDHHFTGSTYMLVAAFLSFLIFDQSVAVSALLFLSLGDPAAAIVGQRFPGPRLLSKSPGGTIAFVAVGLAVVGVLISLGVIEYHWGFLMGVVVAGLVELAPIPLDDNFTIPLVAGTVMQLSVV